MNAITSKISGSSWDLYDLCRIRIAFGAERELPYEIENELTKFRASIIEECAREAETLSNPYDTGADCIAKAIRAVKEKAE